MSQIRPSVRSAASNRPAGPRFPGLPAVSAMRPEGAPPYVRSTASNPPAVPSFPGVPAIRGISPCEVRPDGGWEQEDMAYFSWLENAGVPGLRRRVVPPDVAAISALPAATPSSAMASATMHSGTSFTDLITRGHSYSDMSGSIPHNEKPSSAEVPASVKATKKRTKNFTIDEDEMLISAWLNVSMDPVHGTNQSHSTYWNRIYEYFHTNKTFISDRSQKSLMNRWTGIQHDVNLFAGCISRIEGRNQSGASIADKQADALKMFTNEDEHHGSFNYMHCWKILKDQAKWIERCNQLGTQKTVNKKQKTMANSSPGSSTLLPAAADERQAASSVIERSPGNKKEKAKLRQRTNFEALDYLLEKNREADAEKEMKKELKKEERCNKAFALEEERINLEKKKFEFERDQHEEKIMRVPCLPTSKPTTSAVRKKFLQDVPITSQVAFRQTLSFRKSVYVKRFATSVLLSFFSITQLSWHCYLMDVNALLEDLNGYV